MNYSPTTGLFGKDNSAPTNLLKNPSFEKGDAQQTASADWAAGQSNAARKGPVIIEWSAQARTGNRSLRLHFMHTSEYLRQDVAFADNQPAVFTIYARGGGRFIATILAFAPGADGNKGWKAVASGMFGAADKWLPYSLHVTTPAGTTAVRVVVATAVLGSNIWFDDASLTTGTVALASPTSKQDPPAPETLFDITPYCSLQSDPPAFGGMRVLCDNDLRTMIHPEVGPARGARLAFHFPRPAMLAGIRLVQMGAASYLLDADTGEGDGFSRDLVRVTGEAGDGSWVEHWFEPIKVKSARLVGLVPSGKWAPWDTRAFPSLAELRILVIREPWMETLVPPPQLSAGNAAIRVTPTDATPMKLPAATNRMAQPITAHTARGICISPWMFGWSDKEPSKYSREIIEGYAAEISSLGADHVLLILNAYTGVPWPSSIVRGVKEDVLSPATKAFAKQNIRVFLMSSGTPLMQHAPWPTWFGKHLAEAVDRGCTGVCVCEDEYPQNGGKPDPAFHKQSLKAELGLDEPPAIREDTEAYRRFMLFGYRQVGKFHRQMADLALARNKDCVLVSNWRIDPLALNTTYGCLAYDILAQETRVDYMGTDPYYSDPSRRTFLERSAKLLAAAGRPRGSMPILQSGVFGGSSELDQWPNIVTGGSALAAVMHGATGVSFYRHNYLALNANTHWVREAFALINFLDLSGLRASTEPRNVAVLHSRASEDFWQLRCHLRDSGDPLAEGVRGYVCQKIIEELLLEHSIPATYYYLEREEELEQELKNYPVILLPFPYCISDRAVKAIAAAHDAGAQVIVCDRLGEANELGTLRSAPVFAAREGTFVKDVVGTFWEPGVRARFLAMISKRLGDRQTVTLDAGGRNMEAIVRILPGGVTLLMLINWEDTVGEANVSLHVPDGQYAIAVADKYGLRPGGVKSTTSATTTSQTTGETFLWAAERPTAPIRTKLAAKDLANFSVRLPGQFVQVLLIAPQKPKQVGPITMDGPGAVKKSE